LRPAVEGGWRLEESTGEEMEGEVRDGGRRGFEMAQRSCAGGEWGRGRRTEPDADPQHLAEATGMGSRSHDTRRLREQSAHPHRTCKSNDATQLARLTGHRVGLRALLAQEELVLLASVERRFAFWRVVSFFGASLGPDAIQLDAKSPMSQK
jgi:hypothetical protein